MTSLATAFNTFNTSRLKSPLLQSIWHEAYGSSYATHARPDAFYPQSVLDHIISTFQQNASKNATSRTYLDIGCGHGLTALYLGSQLSLRPHGIDISPASISLAAKNAVDQEAGDAKFWVADAVSSRLDNDTCALVTCLDVLLYLPDKPAVFAEIYRVLMAEGMFAFTSWEQSGYSERLGAQQVDDYRPLLEDVGFEVLSYGEVERSRQQQWAIFDGLVGAEEALKGEIGDDAAVMFANMARAAKKESHARRYVLGIARKKRGSSTQEAG